MVDTNENAANKRGAKIDEADTLSEVSILSEVNDSDTVLNQSLKIQALAAQHGFDWPDVAPVFDKVIEELNELKYELELLADESPKSNQRQLAVEAEFGDLLFSCLNLSRFIGADPQTALQRTNNKFISRFGFIERTLKEQGEVMEQVSLARLDQLWDQAKKNE